MSDALLTLQNVHVAFPAKKNWRGKVTERVHALNGLDIQVRQGETLGIVGESGCGKSTLAKLLMGMLSPTTGQLDLATAAGGGRGTSHANGLSGSALVTGSPPAGLAYHDRTGLDSVTRVRKNATRPG